MDFDTDVIQIRRKAKMSKVDKDWCGYKICVEDPFELDRNLTGGMKIQSLSFFTSEDFFDDYECFQILHTSLNV